MLKQLLIGCCLCLSAAVYGQTNLPIDSILAQGKRLIRADEFESALTLLLDGIKQAEADAKQTDLAKLYYQIARIYIIRENFAKGEEYALRTKKSAQQVEDIFFEARANLLLGILQSYAGAYSKSIEFYQESARLFRMENRYVEEAGALAKIGNIYELEGEFQKATPLFEQFRTIAQAHGNDADKMTADIYLASNAFNLENYDQALTALKTAQTQATQLGRTLEYRYLLDLEAVTQEKLKNYPQCILAMREYIELSDSLNKKETATTIAELETQFQTERKEATIQQQKEKLRRSQLQLWLLLGGLVIATLIGLGFYRLTQRLRRSNQEKEFLIKEVHHRVKNNLQTLSSLLYLQSRHIKDDNALQAVLAGQYRVEAMGLIHQKLYMGEHLATVEMEEYLYQLGENLLDAFGIKNQRVTLEFAVDPLLLDVDSAIPMSLIINELLTNAFKYAFPEERSGKIKIALAKVGEQQVQLKVEDNGIGSNVSTNAAESTSFGTRLIRILSKKLGGTLHSVQHEQGFMTEIHFEKVKMV